MQSAPLIVRNPDTAYAAHGNYGVEYSFAIPLYNNTTKIQTILLKLQTPIKSDRQTNQIFFFKPPADQIFFRGTLEISYRDHKQTLIKRYIHLVQKRGEKATHCLA